VAVHRAQRENGFAERARRFGVELPIRYREMGTRVWHEGRTLNISISGVLFRGSEILTPDRPVEMAFTLPIAIPGDAPGEIVCQGAIVRNAQNGDSGGSSVLAASIVRPRFVHGVHRAIHV
jgi:hypothetical protein